MQWTCPKTDNVMMKMMMMMMAVVMVMVADRRLPRGH
jgi:hypothetical protein